LNYGSISAVSQNGFFSQYIKISRGCRQGDPISPYIFILCAEILAILIKNDKNIKGIKIGESEYKISQYADDTTLILDGSRTSFQSSLNILEYFSTISGLKVNSSKTKIVWIGSKKFSKEVYHHVRWTLDWGFSRFNLLGVEFSVNLREMVDINYKKYIPKIKSLIQQWNRRVISPMGKITVLKTLIIPVLNHLFITLPNPDQNLVRELNSMFFQFIWGNKIDKIKRNVMTGEYEYGGLKMVHLENFIKSLKCTWIRRIMLQNTSYKVLTDIIFGQDITKYIFEFGEAYLDNLTLRCSNRFWKDIILSWKIFVSRLHEIKNDVLLEPLWYNYKLRIGNRPVFIKQWYSCGIKIVGDLISNDNLLTKIEFQQKFQLENVCDLTYFGLCEAIRERIRNRTLRDEMVNVTYPYIPQSFSLLVKAKKGCKDFYYILNNNKTIPSHQGKWISVLNTDLNWKGIYKNCFKTSDDTKLQWFQYRIINRILPIKDYLKKIDVSQDDLCSFCGIHIEDMQHLFFYCDKSRDIWINLENIINNKTSINVSFSLKEILFGLPASVFTPLNYIILVTKYYLYSCSKRRENVHIFALMNYLRDKYCIEKYIAQRNMKSNKFLVKWGIWKTIFE